MTVVGCAFNTNRVHQSPLAYNIEDELVDAVGNNRAIYCWDHFSF